MNTDHDNGMSPFDLGTNKIEIEQNVTPIVNPQTFDPTPDDRIDGGSAASGQSGTATLPGPKTDAIEFRVIRPGVPIRRLRLTGNRYTFGSAEGCSIRLNDPSLRPMHAVLIRDAHRVLVRAYSVPLEINGNRITETSLVIGDVMRMGAYRFELLSGVDPAAERTDVYAHNPQYGQYPSSAPASAAYSVSPPPYPTAQSPYAGSYPVAGQTTSMGNAEQQALQARVQRESAQWRLRQSEVDLRENRCIERENELRSREAELWARADQVHRRETHLMAQESAATQIHDEFAARKEELQRLREERKIHQDLLQERQTQIEEMESDYRSRVEKATQQLEQSQQQAESATDAVQRMREQFAALNEQLESLTLQQQNLEQHDDSHLEQHRQLRRELETARDEAIDARAESEAKRKAAEDRVVELTEQLQAFENDTASAQEKNAESEELTRQLQQQVEELQLRVDEATSEATRLREDYEGACASIRQLELLVDQTASDRDDARNSLNIESDSLRQSVEQLTLDLGKANIELQELREANDELVRQVAQVSSERDEAKLEIESRPTADAWADLRSELDDANSRLEQMQREYTETLSRIDFHNEESSKSGDHDPDGGEPNDVLQPTSGDSVAINKLTDTTTMREFLAEDNMSPEEPNDVESETSDSNSFSSIAGGLALGAAGVASSVWGSESNGDEESSLESPESPIVEATEETAADVEAEANVWSATATDETGDAPTNNSVENTSVWRQEPQQTASDSSHLSAWDTSESDTEPTAPAAWQAEAPEIAVNEAIDDLERSVDQAIADIEADTLGDSTPGVEASAPSSFYSETSDQQPNEPESESSAEATMSWGQSPEVESDGEVANEIENEGYTPINPWAQTETDASAPQESSGIVDEPGAEVPEAGSLADMLIRDLGNEDAVEPMSVPSQYQDESIPDEPVGSTFVMEEAVPDTGVDESPSWNLERPDSHEELGSNPYDQPSASYGESADVDQEQHSTSFESPYEAETPTYDSEPSAYDPETPSYASEASELEAAQSDDDSSTASEYDPGFEQETSYEADTSGVVAGNEPTQEDGSSEDAGDEDDSIEAYMNRLLQRVQTEDGDDDSPTKSIPLSDGTMPLSTSDTAALENGAETEPVDPDAPLVPRSHAPERDTDMSAMRRLANESARSAVARSVKTQARDTQMKAMYKFGSAGVTAVCALVLYWFLAAAGPIAQWFAVAMALLVTAILANEGIALWRESNSRIRAAEAAAEAGEDMTDFETDAAPEAAPPSAE